MEKHIHTPITEEITKDLKAGDYVYLSGTVYTARDAAHKRMEEALDKGESLPVDPTTASRMDKYTPRLLDMGLKAMIGKGKRSKEVTDAIVRNRAVYLAAVGGAGALISKCIKKAEVICYDDLGTEAVRKLEVEDFPMVVVIDAFGNDFYKKNSAI